MNQIVIFLANGFEEIEALTVVDICRRAKMAIYMVSVGSSIEVVGSHGIKVIADKIFQEVDFEKVDMLVLPGGLAGTKNLEAHQEFMEKVDNFYKSGKWLAAICAAPSILGHRGILKGKKACCYPGFEEQLEGAEVVTEETTVQAEHIITARGMGCSIDFALKIVEVFLGQKEAQKLAEQIVYKK